MPRSRHRKKSTRKSLSRRFTDPSSFNEPVEDQKMSEVLLEFIQPYRKFAPDDSSLENLIATGIVAWNVSLLPTNERDAALDKFATELFRGARTSLLRKLVRPIGKLIGVDRSAGVKAESAVIRDFKDIAHEMIERKLKRFAQNRRFIVSYQVNVTEDDVQLFVASTLQQIGSK